MKSKYRFRRILSGVMAAVTILSTVISPLTVYASEEPKAAEPPAYESVKDQLDENEVVKATDLELEVGQDFDVSTDFPNLEIKDESKVKVTFQKAENDAGENFSTSHADTYHAVYYVEPVNQNHPVYQIGRNLIVKEPVTAAQSEPQTEQAVTEEDTGSDDEEAASPDSGCNSAGTGHPGSSDRTSGGTSFWRFHRGGRSLTGGGGYVYPKPYESRKHLDRAPGPCCGAGTFLGASGHVDRHGRGTLRQRSSDALPSAHQQLLRLFPKAYKNKVKQQKTTCNTPPSCSIMKATRGRRF